MTEEHGIVGRTAERGDLLAALGAIEAASAAGCLRVRGLAGFGKTALLAAISAEAAVRGWRVLDARCHLVRAQIPLAVVRDLFTSVHSSLGDAALRYVGGLPATTTGGAIEESLYRLIEGLLVDSPVLLVVDDTQWLDSESQRVLAHVLQLYAERPVALLVAERGRAATRLGSKVAAEVTIAELDPGSLASIVCAIWPEVGPVVLERIVSGASGHPLTAAMLARDARKRGVAHAVGVASSVRGIVAHEVERMNPKQREFLQVCSLIDEPLDRRLLERVFGLDRRAVEELIELSEPEFLAAGIDAAFFSHAAIAEALRQTIPVDVPLRRRILSALHALGTHSLDDHERMVRQAAACGEPAAERDALLALARDALSARAWATAAGAFRRAFQIAEPFDEDFARSYSTYANALITSDEPLEACRVLEVAITAAMSMHLERGFGELVAAFIVALWYREAFEQIPVVFNRYASAARTPVGQQLLCGVVAHCQALRLDVQGFAEAKRLALSRSIVSSPDGLLRLYQAEAIMEARLGNRAGALEALKLAAAIEPKSDLRARAFEYSVMLTDHFEFGIEPMRRYLSHEVPIADEENSLTYSRYLQGFTHLACGEFDSASLLVEDSLMRRTDRANYRRILTIAAAVSALTGEPSPQAALMDEAARSALEMPGDSAVPLCAWWAAALVETDAVTARPLAHEAWKRARKPLEATELLLRLPFALYAEWASDEELLLDLADGEWWSDRTPWHFAHETFARGIARKALARPGANEELMGASRRLAGLGAPLYAALAAHLGGSLDDAQRTLLRLAGVLRDRDVPRLTPRQAQVATLTSAGRTPLQIAQALVLSQRTVEHYVSNLKQFALDGSA